MKEREVFIKEKWKGKEIIRRENEVIIPFYY